MVLQESDQQLDMWLKKTKNNKQTNKTNLPIKDNNISPQLSISIYAPPLSLSFTFATQFYTV